MLDGLFNVSIQYLVYSLHTSKNAIYYILFITHLLIVCEHFRRIKMCVSIMPSMFYAVVVQASIEDHTYMTKHSRS
jgi:hypothetical protein